NDLGWHLRNGIGASLDRSAASQCFRRAAKFGSSSAAYNLGLLYLSERRRAQGASWLRRAASIGHAKARGALANIDRTMERELEAQQPTESRERHGKGNRTKRG